MGVPNYIFTYSPRAWICTYEFLYYVFFVVEQYKLQAEDFQIYFLGEIPSFKSYYQAIKQYHTPIQFKENALTSAIDIDQHPAPFMAQSSY